MFNMAGEIDDRWEFRQIIDFYPGNIEAPGAGEIHFMGLKSGLSLWNNRITLASGLRYIRVNERISSPGNTTLYLFHPSNMGVELFRIREMKETLGYAGIPLEAELLLWGQYSNWQCYVKGGIQAGVKIHGDQRIDFPLKEMEKYKDEIFATAGKAPSNFFSNAYTSIGLRLILTNGLHLSVEGLLPSSILTKNNFSLLTSQLYGGVQFTVSTPVNLFSSK
jgi:hypothetical protein